MRVKNLHRVGVEICWQWYAWAFAADITAAFLNSDGDNSTITRAIGVFTDIDGTVWLSGGRERDESKDQGGELG